MKKVSVIILLFVSICTVAWVGTTYLIGNKVEKDFSALVKQSGNMGMLSVTLEDYRRGVLSSTAQTIIELKIPEVPSRQKNDVQEDAPLKSVRLVFDHALHHGPFLSGALGFARIETRLTSISPGEKEFKELLQEFPQLKEPLLVTKFAFDGALVSRLEIQPIESRIDGDFLSWGGVTAETTFSPHQKSLSGSFAMPGLTLSGTFGEIAWDGAHGQFDLIEAMPLVYVGKNEAKISALKLNFPNKETGELDKIELKGFGVSASSSCDGKLVQAEQTMTFAGLTMKGQTYGPGVLEVELRNLDGAALGDYQKQLSTVFNASGPASPDQFLLQLLPIYSQLLTRLAEGNLQLNIRRLHFVTPMGEIDGNLLLSFAGGKGMDMNDPLALLQRLEASAELVVQERLVRSMMVDSAEGKLRQAREAGNLRCSDAELTALAAKQAGTLVEGVLAQNFAIREGDRLKTKASFHGGELVVNGQRLPLFQ